MSWDGPERRKRTTNESGRFRRRGDLKEAWGRIESTELDIEAMHVLVTGLIDSVARVDEKLDLVKELCVGIDGKADKATSFKNAIQFAAVVIVPVLVALIGAYALLKSQAPAALPK